MVRDPRTVDVVAVAHPRGCRSYLVIDPISREACVVDPLLDHLRETLDALADNRATVRWVVETHAHGDHLSGAAALHARTGAEVVAHPAADSEVATHRAADGDTLPLGQHELLVHHAPGITRDAIVLEAPGALFTGDTLLIGTVGLRDAPGSDPHAWYETLDRVFGERDEATILHPGHDDMGRDMTTIKAERRGNRWLREDDRDAFLALYRADERTPRPDAEQVLSANRQGLTKLPSDVESASGFAPPTETVEQRSGPKRMDDPANAAAPSGFAGLLVLCGVLCALGTVLGWWWRPELHALSLLSALIMLGAGVSQLEGRRRGRRAKGPDFYYTGPSKFTQPDS
ncbi:MAG: MBL fold metallo-hydrolase [Planctomycetota bacterium]|nr:MBL fold metallo-hydrolase [Planctomycetota bacterium]